jgi:uncharacterized protein (TIGR00299 family) protein
MKRTLYFDCFAGISGDMTLGALVAAGVDAGELIERLKLLGLTGYEISFEKVVRSGIGATRAKVVAPHEHHHRHLSDIHKIIFNSRLQETVKGRAAKIFLRLADAEARVHDVSVESIHFHEVGGVDAIVDIVGACIGFDLLGIEKFVCSPLHVGSGLVEMAHGRFPIPPPAVVELLQGAPIYATDIVGELVTPTGAAIVATLCEEFGPLPRMRVELSGYGAGSRDYEGFPNALRIMVGAPGSAGEVAPDGRETLFVVESNVDDTSPQLLGHLMELAIERGALDCFFTPVQMKKNRPGVLISILCRPADRDAMFELLFTETTTIGARSYEVERRALEREVVMVETEYGPIGVKVSRFKGRITSATPEYEQCRAAALKANLALKIVEAAARAAVDKVNDP